MNQQSRDASRHCTAAKNLPELPRLKLEFELGRVSWSAVREIVRVATPRTEQEWIEFYFEHKLYATTREVAEAYRADRDAPREHR